MDWLHDISAFDVAYFFGGAFLANAIPHLAEHGVGCAVERRLGRLRHEP